MRPIRTLTGPLLAVLTLLALAVPASAQATCYADFKAKRDKPYELIYGVMQVSACSRDQVKGDVRKRLAKAGFDLLNIVSVFDDSGLDSRKANAGPYYLRF
ncbi:hypothetical protein KM176_09080 [Pseudooceanicola sp. CBS1P-1]|uniref:DUF3718 domain-containing protein n=1 Tax=Pseudooceanicola albus TaxID=2692189 RepID=A0A6L7FZ41_9RHOB|nr:MULTISPECIES: hypothetical protein [Pseudooceanicola]MBT9384008.1 hypothetical protein [Pseudooceanicola endophyticus]MXN16580.1 hypothetical protein [Pseudooceanicola albus]